MTRLLARRRKTSTAQLEQIIALPAPRQPIVLREPVRA